MLICLVIRAESPSGWPTLPFPRPCAPLLLPRSANYDSAERRCRLSKEDRRTQRNALRPARGTSEYLENQCAKRESELEGQCAKRESYLEDQCAERESYFGDQCA